MVYIFISVNSFLFFPFLTFLQSFYGRKVDTASIPVHPNDAVHVICPRFSLYNSGSAQSTYVPKRRATLTPTVHITFLFFVCILSAALP